MRIFSIIIISLLLTCGVMAKTSTPSEHLEGRVEGIILNLDCAAMSDAQITLANKKTKQLIKP